MARLTGKVALITGAAGGQGAAEAELFMREGAAVVLTDIDAAAGEALARRLTGQGGKALFLRQDVADEASWRGGRRGGNGAVRQTPHPGQQCRDDRPPGHRRHHDRSLEPDDRGQPDRRRCSA